MVSPAEGESPPGEEDGAVGGDAGNPHATATTTSGGTSSNPNSLTASSAGGGSINGVPNAALETVLATAGYDHTIKLWHIHTALCVKTFQHPDSVCFYLISFF